jgi:hypothetical protein
MKYISICNSFREQLENYIIRNNTVINQEIKKQEIPNDAIMLFKIGERQWIEKLYNGELCFSCVGKYIKQAERTKNDIQGDRYEAVFAKLLKNNPKICEMRNLLQNDLEEFEENGYIYLRRKSARLIPVFCLYAFTEQVLIDENHISSEEEVVLIHKFDNNMFAGFTYPFEINNVLINTCRFAGIVMQPLPFTVNIRCQMQELGYEYYMGLVNYNLMNENEFFINPSPAYKELFYKMPYYNYQNEARIILHKNIFTFDNKKLVIKMKPLKSEDKGLIDTKFEMSYKASFIQLGK